MNLNTYTVPVTTDASGDAVAYTPTVNGRLINIIYTKAGTNGLDTATFAIVGETTGVSLWGEASVNASKTVAPAQPLHSQAGAALLYAAGGAAVTGPIYLVDERIKITISSGGATKSGSFLFVVDGPS